MGCGEVERHIEMAQPKKKKKKNNREGVDPLAVEVHEIQLRRSS